MPGNWSGNSPPGSRAETHSVPISPRSHTLQSHPATTHAGSPNRALADPRWSLWSSSAWLVLSKARSTCVCSRQSGSRRAGSRRAGCGRTGSRRARATGPMFHAAPDRPESKSRSGVGAGPRRRSPGRPHGQRDLACALPQDHDRSRAPSRSLIRSSACSIPTDTRSVLSVIPAPARASADIDAWLIVSGCSMSDSTPPSDSAME